MVRIRCFHCGDLGLIPGQGTEILQAVWSSQKKKKLFLTDLARENSSNRILHTLN